MTDLKTWLHDNDGLYVILRYKKIYTPYEQDKKFLDESAYEDQQIVKILDVIEIPNDVLLHCQEYCENCDNGEYKMSKLSTPFYVRLSDIKMWDYEEEENEGNETEEESNLN